jgi:glycosyltransferase involved in cell wall biosynthesis
MKKSICIISYSPIASDARVLRQIRYLAPHYRLTVIGYGERHPAWGADVTWAPVRKPRGPGAKGQAVLHALVSHLRLTTPGYLEWHLRANLLFAETVRLATAAPHAAVIANDHDALPAGCAAAKTLGAKLVFDAHEHAPSLYDDDPRKRVTHVPVANHILRTYAVQADASLTVAGPIAERYAEEFGFHPLVVMNAPEVGEAPDHPVDPARINLIHHGVPLRDRRLDWMIDAVAAADARYHLHFMLTWPDSRYLKELKAHAEAIAPGRVTFHPAVPTEQVVPTIAQYDMGFYLLNPSKYNNVIALPNKFFDFLSAGLPPLIGPSPSMAALIEEHGCGWVSPSFTPADAAAILNRLTTDDILAARTRARAAAGVVNARTEMAKLVALLADVVGERA